MGRHLVPLTVDNLADLPDRCRSCVFWERAPDGADAVRRTGRAELVKREWTVTVLREWGSCGRLAYVDGRPVGFLLYAPPSAVPRSLSFPTGPVTADAVQLMTAWIALDHRGQGIGRVLVQSMAKDLLLRGVRAVEAFGDARPRAASASEPYGDCLAPARYLEAVGFEEVRPHPHVPRLRLELRRTVSWRVDMEQAWDRLFHSGRPRGVLHPA
ncbi:GNAT family N-acetyltransferase [Streptomyces avicenniae]|uniref:GNAT family N-acetyltransferase n=1 Tax=Streptomyces avicenniae TaxID=500153 RepID=UPI000AB3A952|nr:GNAT family N-acetyltransferase [Streptomyces avicenniae]